MSNLRGLTLEIVGSKQNTKCRIYALQLGNTNTNIEMSSVNKISITNNL